ncbi:hypothetical protein MMC16_007396 [Acarospora aff. strigata]|nr:hypothetical protein [Acarospora aff. strigata]
MDAQHHRGRSLSAGHANHNINPSSSPHRYHDSSAGFGLDPSMNASTFNTSSFNNSNPSLSNGGVSFNVPTPFINSTSQAPKYPQPNGSDNTFLQDQSLQQSFKQDHQFQNHPSPSQFGQQESSIQYSSNYLDPSTTGGFNDFPLYQNGSGGQEQTFDPSFLLDPELQRAPQTQNPSINPAELMSNMSSPNSHTPTPPNLLQPDLRSSSGQRASPSSNQSSLYTPNHSRHTSLDPSSAAFPLGQPPTDWTGMLGAAAFQGHRRAPSEHSDVSSSVAPSPFLVQQDSFESIDQNHSPHLNAQQDQTMYQDALAFEQFSLSDPQQLQQRISPGHSPYVSPRISPQHGLGISQENPFMLSQTTSNQFGVGPAPEIYTHQPEESFPSFQLRNGSTDLGQAAQMAPPEINVEFAPPSRQSSFEPTTANNDLDALSPPERGRRGRTRAKSDPYGIPMARPLTQNPTVPNLERADSDGRNRSLSPFDFADDPSGSRDTSPNSKSSRRSSTSSIPNRDYILDLADPLRPGASATDSKRIQKHPATFQCTLCPKKFTRAYNLRSHLRTHTDERPFVCTVCGKAFARQHDRKRHEGLHSGEKKFVCRGELASGGNWGCGRRFARADALGRHFRSEAGRVCIKPLLDEEALERQRLYNEQMLVGSHQAHQQHQQHGNNSMHGLSGPGPGPMDLSGGNNSGGFTLPAALLAQYPALQGLQWDQLGAPGPGDEADLSGQGSFDGSGGDYFDEEDGGGGYVSGPGTGYAAQQMGWGGPDWASDVEGR